MKMRAFQQVEWGDGPDACGLVEVDRPVPAPTEILVKVEAAGVNPVDHYTRLGVAYNRVLSLPFVNGWDVAGVVEEVGYGVTLFRPGDRVFGMPWFPRQAGGYAEYVTAPSRQFALLPAGLSFTEAAALPLAGLTAWQMLVDVGQIQAGQRVLVTAAAGGVGHLAVQIAKAHGAHVIGTARAAKHQFLYDLGVDEAIDYTTTEVSDAIKDIDVLVQMFGGEQALQAMQCLRPGGIMVNSQGAWTPGMGLRAAELGVRATAFLVEPDAAGLENLTELIQSGDLRVHVDRELPLAAALEAHELMATARTSGKVVLTIDHEETR
ncbi:NADP-dependent oxidoreductase [Kribbella shirazensis]|uniref:NADPH:quinone reductase-like Zn-dependent oxidoreductase n=1 Tax=Kribbella shirazensis TaxID=1105143 RepID=A0A7X5VC91_9ACTN|nr:NADP-dependent oxidoreductase [Kribbella shirazensis]NIK58498.1 NADPH:quinone reductase-like Zn-dependent oxidoreductase [Kribbella shirazensis]